MTKYLWRDLSFDEEANTQLLEHFCRRGTSENDPTKPEKLALLQLLLKNMEGVPILSRGNVSPRRPRPSGGHAGGGLVGQVVADSVSVSTAARPHAADSLAAQACGRKTCQDGVREGNQDCAGEDAGSGAGGREDQVGSHCGFAKGQEGRTLQGNDGEAGEAPSMPQAVQGRGM
jgi:hypothetical protein